MAKSNRALLAALTLIACQVPGAAHDSGERWSNANLATLDRWIEAAPLDALPPVSKNALDQARNSRVPGRIDEEADRLALRLARMHLLGAANHSGRAGWNINDTDANLPLDTMLARGLADGNLDTFFALMRPAHQEYAALRSAYQVEPDVQHKRTIARNMERWRWMPRSLGKNYVLVNIVGYEASLWREAKLVDHWRVIIGKRSTPTPVFETQIEGVILNPWWDIPASIVRESVGALVRRNPSLARARGYVWSGGRYRQRPGPNNALGQMKLVMPNRFSVFMHDTPNKQLFEEDVRSFSHGCIRTDDAIGYAATLLQDIKTREEIDVILASGQTTQIEIGKPLPLYVTYFTAVSDGLGRVKLLDDLYDRDRRIAVPASLAIVDNYAADDALSLLRASYGESAATQDANRSISDIEC
ncbi:L,D-transpeptidase family protein [Pontixanthobacter gangjinensis]|uniref:L,D-transpeptidase family protein n=1 Tax=Pontixanthobacter gangjinensis TaxID=1028742 RepID=A0A6I4SS11_9SPHN|nr:L,D-transpeptidase family protein [Pontixanthobacter gangjinensis]MXO57292.1 L,D-transpeptidase family protein [Pontixanthobacter gangjinensis]